MTLLEIIEHAREVLPSVQDVELNYYRVPLSKEIDYDLLMEIESEAPASFDYACYIVEFRKQIIAGVIIGWEFVQLCNGY